MLLLAQHEHGISVAVSIGPVALRVILLAAVPVVAGFAMLRAFLPEPDRATARWVAACAAVVVILEFMLAGALDIPARAGLLVLAVLAVPVYLASSADRRAILAAGYARRLAPWVLTLACVLASVEFGRAWLGTGPDGRAALLHTGLVIAVTGLAWLTLGLPRSRAARVAIHVQAAVLAVAVVAGAGQATGLGLPG